MADIKRRRRMVNFRLSDDEYRDIQNVCSAAGYRSLSDFARSAVCRFATPTTMPPEEFAVAMSDLDGRIEHLDREVKRLAHLVQACLIALKPEELASVPRMTTPGMRR